MRNSTRSWRQLTVWLHVLSSVGWMSLALVLFALLALAVNADGPNERAGAATAANYLDTVLLAPLANASAFTGIMLALGTAWGLTHHWWVLIKFAITVVQLYLGIFVLSDALREVAVGAEPPAPQLMIGTAAMAGAIAFQGWLSVAKPWGRTPWVRGGRAAKLPTGGAGVFLAGTLTPLFDIALGTAMGHPMPAASLIVLVVMVVVRTRRLRARANDSARVEARA